MGALPLSPEAMEQALRLNGADVARILRAFRLGRLSFADPEMEWSLLAPDEPAMTMAPKPVDTLEWRLLRGWTAWEPNKRPLPRESPGTA
jgi:indolepyruvate ferredoxin oxidoreductase